MRGGPRLFAGRAAAVAGAGLAMVLIAFLFDAAPLFVVGVALLLIAAISAGWVWLAALGARTQRRLDAERVIEGEPLSTTIVIRRGVLGLPGAQLSDPFTGARRALHGRASPFSGGRTARLTVVHSFARRGWQRLEPPRLQMRDPLDLARAEAGAGGQVQTVLVLPRIEPVRWDRHGRGRLAQLREGDSEAEALAAVEVDGLRPYRPGTPASRIHWPALARGAGLLERRLQSDGDSRPLVVLDARGDDDVTVLDAAVRAAASLAHELARLGGCGLLLPGDQRATTIDRDLITWPAAHARLAVVGGGAHTPAPALGVLGGRLGAMIYVAARAPERLSSAEARGRVLLVVPEANLIAGRPVGLRSAAAAVLTVSGCRGFLLGARRLPERPGSAVRAPA